MQTIIFGFTTAGPLCGFAAWWWNVPALLYLGIGFCLVNLALDLASGAMKFPVLPIFFMASGLWLPGPWYIGIGKGLLAYSTVEVLCVFLKLLWAQLCKPSLDNDRNDDEAIYRKLHPLMVSALQGIAQGSNERTIMRAVIDKLADHYGTDAVSQFKPYIVRFVAEQYSPSLAA